MSLLDTLIALRDECGPADTGRRQRLDKAIDDMRSGGVASLLGIPARAATATAA